MTAVNPHNLTVVVPARLAVMGRPGIYASLEADLETLRNHGIGAIVSLTDTPLPAEVIAARGFVYLHEPVADFTAPTPAQLDRILEFIDRQEAAGRMVLVHCGAGLGRSGTVAAVYLVKRGSDPQAAIRQVREVRPFAIETREQEEAVAKYAERLRQMN